jgi:predicted Zn-dependent protease
MKFTPRGLKENVNVTPISPLRELFVLLGAILGALLVIYLVLGFALDVLVMRMPEGLEEKIGAFFSHSYRLKEPSANELKIQKLLDEIASLVDEKELDLTVYVSDSPEVNALALPGGNVLVFSGLLEEIESENELSMILAHEIGHFINRDHLRGLGRGLVLVAISAVVFGADSTVANAAQRILLTTDLKFSRRQELAADKFAVRLLNKKYGHVGGAYDFFERVKAKRGEPRFLKFLSTHPASTDRITLLEAEIREKGYLSGDKVPLRRGYRPKKKELDSR